MTESYNFNKITNDEIEQSVKIISKEVPEIEKFGFLKNLSDSLIKRKQNILPDNPFQKVKGNYVFNIDISKSAIEKTEYIHRRIADYIFEKTGKLCVFRPGDNSRIYPLETLRDSKQMSYKVSKLLKDAPKEIQNLLTQYPESGKSKVTIRITDEPIDIVKKSTHQSWTSCEKIGDRFCQGVFSDIENNNAIAYIYLDDNKQPDGRFMLRWCKTKKGKADIGIEPIMYPRKSYSMEIYEILRGIIGSKGYGSYKSCKTPYDYKGYSDYIGGSGVITYRSGSTENVLIQYASLPDISRNLALALAEHTVNVNIRRALSENKSICQMDDVVNKMSKDIDSDVRKHLVETCSKSPNKLTDIAFNNLLDDENKDIRASLAKNVKDLNRKYLDKFMGDVDEVRQGLAGNESICKHEDLVNKLSLDKYRSIKEDLIRTCSRHPNRLTDIAINNLINDENINVKGNLALVANLDKKYLDKLSDMEDFVRFKLAYNEAICKHEDLVNKLSLDNKEDVKQALISTCSRSPKKLTGIATNNLLNDKNEDIRRVMVSHLTLTNEILNRFIKDTGRVRQGLAENESICEHRDAVNKLSLDSDKSVKISLIRTCFKSQNNLNDSAINNMLDDKDESVRVAIASSPNLDKKYFNRLVEDTDNVRIELTKNSSLYKYEDLVNKLSLDNDEDVKLSLINSGNLLTKTAIENLIKDKNEDIRINLAYSVPEVRKRLAYSLGEIEDYMEAYER